MMTDTIITVGGRDFTVACREGEERFLHGAAALLDAEARVLIDQMGRVPEGQMLLMAGLMLADKTASLQEKLRLAEEKLVAREERLAELEQGGATLSEDMAERLSELAERAEALAGP